MDKPMKGKRDPMQLVRRLTSKCFKEFFDEIYHYEQVEVYTMAIELVASIFSVLCFPFFETLSSQEIQVMQNAILEKVRVNVEEMRIHKSEEKPRIILH